MKYISTRGNAPAKNFSDVVTSGLASDGGLYVPEITPQFSIEQIRSWKNIPYPKLAFNIIKPFVDSEIPDSDLLNIIEEGCKNFTTSEITPLKKLGDNLYILELFHGPTLAFKDVALQFLGKLQDYILTKQKQDIVIIGATPGDTGSAAIYGVKDCKHIKLFMLHPHNRVSEIQRHQMTTVISPNIFNIAVGTNFDDCQEMVKEMFNHPEFMKGLKISAVNSINWARIVAQVVYYFYAVLKVNGGEKPVSFSVPSGNLGDVFAGYMAKRMGLPINLLIVSTNENDILHRFFSKNDYSRQGVKQTVAPSMDIQVSSNFERLLFLEHNYDGKKIAEKMSDFKKTGKLKVDPEIHKNICNTFKSFPSNDNEIKTEIKRVFEKYNYIVCPHTATGTRAGEAYRSKNEDMIVLATAHPAKFPAVVVSAINVHPKPPKNLENLLSKKEKFEIMPNNIDLIKNYIYQHSI